MRLCTLLGSVLVTLAVAMPVAEDATDTVPNVGADAPSSGSANYLAPCGKQSWLDFHTGLFCTGGPCERIWFTSPIVPRFSVLDKYACSFYSTIDCRSESKIQYIKGPNELTSVGNVVAYKCSLW